MFSINNMSQMSFNFIEQSKNKNKLLRGEEEQDGNPSHLPPIPSGDFWARTHGHRRILKSASGFEKKWRFGPEGLKAFGEGGLPLSRRHFIAEATS
jgi:hypothetical protein